MPKDHKRNTVPMQEARENITKEKLRSLEASLLDMSLSGEKMTVKNAARNSGVSESFVYKNETAKSLFEKYKNSLDKTDVEGYDSTAYRRDLSSSDLWLQYMETKRKLSESYVLMEQMLVEENKFLSNEIKAKLNRVEKLKQRPNLIFHIIPTKNVTGDYSYSLKVVKSGGTYAPLSPAGESFLDGITWGKYIFSSSSYSFKLKDSQMGVRMETKGEDYIITIAESILEDCTIDIILDKK